MFQFNSCVVIRNPINEEKAMGGRAGMGLPFSQYICSRNAVTSPASPKAPAHECKMLFSGCEDYCEATADPKGEKEKAH